MLDGVCVETGRRFIIAAVVPRGEGSGMSAILELFLEFAINVVVYVLEAMADSWLGGSDSRGSRIFWCVVIVLLGIVIWWELR
jgi:hypothetical protein